MGFFDLFKTPQQSTKSAQSFDVTVTVDGKNYVNGFGSQPKNADFEARIKRHNDILIPFYNAQTKEYAYGEDITERLLKQISPMANSNTCPYCGVVHPFTASRARKCPACSEKMVVRKGKFYTEKDIEKLDSISSDYYEKTQQVERLKSVLQTIQDNKLNNNYGRCFLYISEAYDCCAVVRNQSFEGGFTFWDYGWGVLNKDALDAVAVTARSQSDLIMNGYSDILYARGMHLMRELKNNTSDKSKTKFAKIATNLFIEYLFELARNQISDWHEEEAPKMIQVALKLGSLDPTWINESAEAILKQKNMQSPDRFMAATVSKVQDFTIIENEPDQLKWMIY
ncbi:hypothetical protein EYC58_00190 [Candidatus Saccharibacteria bacterium]|nr:MAG: hypothetical protein EYC58_00190 [Candidatus Saccharibacteria bacterium]